MAQTHGRPLKRRIGLRCRDASATRRAASNVTTDASDDGRRHFVDPYVVDSSSGSREEVFTHYCALSVMCNYSHLRISPPSSMCMLLTTIMAAGKTPISCDTKDVRTKTTRSYSVFRQFRTITSILQEYRVTDGQESR